MTAMSGYTIANLKEVEDQAPKFGLSPELEARNQPLQVDLGHPDVVRQLAQIVGYLVVSCGLGICLPAGSCCSILDCVVGQVCCGNQGCQPGPICP